MFLVCLFLLQLDDCVLCRVYRTDERIYKRSWHASGLDESGPSSSKIPRLDLNPNLNEVNNPYEEIQMPLQAQQPQPRTEIFQAPQEHDHFALQSNTPQDHMRSSTIIIASRCLSKPNGNNLELKYSKPLKNQIILLCKAPNTPSWTLVS